MIRDDAATMEDLLAGATTPVRLICLPAELSDMVQPPELADNYIDGFLDPKRMSRKVLLSKLADLGPYGYAGQYEQRPIPLSGGMFHWDKIAIGPPPEKFEEIVRFWDKAATKDGDGACTAGVKMGRAHKDCARRWWILDCVRGRWDAWTREKIMKQTAMLDGRGVRIGMEQEPGSGGKESAINSIRNLAGFKVFAERPTGDKFERADPFAGQVNGEQVGMAPGAWNTAYLEEMKHFGPLSKYKDQIDASSGNFNYLSKVKIKAGGAGFLWLLFAVGLAMGVVA